MSSDLIKQMVARILATIKNQYPNSYSDDGKKEQIVRTILSKIDVYSHCINQQTAAQIVQKIIKEIISEHPPDKRTQKVNYPQKPRVNPQYVMESSDRYAQAQFERGNLLSGRPTMISHRPIPTNNKTSNRRFNDVIEPNTDMEDGDDDQELIDPVKRMEAERNKIYADARQRPPTPNFSLDNPGKRKKIQSQQDQQSKQGRQTKQRTQTQPQQKRHDFEHNPQAKHGIIGVNELPQNNSGFSSYDTVDEGINNVDIMNAGINFDDPKLKKFNNNRSVTDRLNDITNGRDDIEIDKSHKLPPPRGTSIREQFEEQQKKKSETNDIEETDLYTLVDNHINNNHINDNPIPQQRPIEQKNQSRKQNIRFDNDDITKQQYQKILHELNEYKQINEELQNRIVKLQTQNTDTNQDDGQLITKLSQLKEETMGELQKLKNIQESNNEFEKKIKKIIGENITKFENGEDTVIICSNHTILHEPIKNVTSIELKDFDLPFNKYNVTNNNNKLHFKVLKNIIRKDDDNNDDNNDDVDLIEIDENNDNITLSVINGNYDINALILMLNKILTKYEIMLALNNNILTLKSKNKFDLIFDENTMFNNLGFMIQNQTKYTNSNKYIGSRPYNFKIDRYINIYITNINETRPIMQYALSNDKNQTKKIVFAPIIAELNELNFKFTDSEGKEFKFDPDFEIHATVKYINSNQNAFKNELNDSISSEDELAIVKNSL